MLYKFYSAHTFCKAISLNFTSYQCECGKRNAGCPVSSLLDEWVVVAAVCVCISVTFTMMSSADSSGDTRDAVGGLKSNFVSRQTFWCFVSYSCEWLRVSEKVGHEDWTEEHFSVEFHWNEETNGKIAEVVHKSCELTLILRQNI